MSDPVRPDAGEEELEPARHPSRGRVIVIGLTAVGVLLLAVSTVIELGDADPRPELAAAVAAGAVLLVAFALSRGTTVQVFARRARLLVGAGVAALLAVSALWQATERAAPRVLLLLVPVCLMFGTAALAVREADVQARRARLRELRAHQDGQERERRRWVRELHDETLQEMAAVQTMLGAAAASTDPDSRTKGILTAREVVSRQIQTLRRLITLMRPLSLDALGLGAALEALAYQTVELTGIDVEVYADGLPRLKTDTETQIYRIAQEALTNAVRHSGATRITVEATHDPRRLELVVRDNGGRHPTDGRFTPGYGLTGMRERAETLGAALTITPSAPDHSGTVIRLEVALPLP